MKKIQFSLIFAALSLGFVHSSSAQGMDLAELQMLEAELDETSDVSEMKCLNPESKSGSAIFLFDGSMGFCPRYFIMQKPRFDLNQKGLSFAERISQTVVTLENSKLVEKIQKKLASEDVIRNCLLVKTVLTQMRSKIVDTKADLFYYSKRGEKEAASCAQTLSKSNSELRLKVIAYSMGSEAAMRFARLLAQSKQPIEEVQSMDPVGRNVNWVTGVITTEDNALFEVPSNVARWFNFFQKQDRYSLLNTSWAHLGIRGSRVIGANLNHEILASDFPDEARRKKGHVHILTQPLVLQSMRDRIE